MLEDSEADRPASEPLSDDAPMDLIFGRQNPLSRLLSDQRMAQGHRVITSALPSLDVTGQTPLQVKQAPILWLPGGLVPEMPEDCSEGDLRAAARRVAAAAQFLGVRRAVVVTDFMPGEIEQHGTLMPDHSLPNWRQWTSAEIGRFINKLPGTAEKRRYAAYFALVQQLQDRQIPSQVVHCGLLIGESDDGRLEHNPALQNLLAGLLDGSLRLKSSLETQPLPLCAADTAARLIAHVPELQDPTAGSLWLYDWRTVPMGWVIDAWCARLDCPSPWQSRARALLEALNVRDKSGSERWLTAARHRRHDNRLERALAERIGLAWPSLPEVLKKTASWWLQNQRGAAVRAKPEADLPSPREVRARAGESELPLPRRF